MKTLTLITNVILAFLLTAVVTANVAYAQPDIDGLKVQGYMRLANGDPVTDGTYDLVFGVFQNGGQAIWAQLPPGGVDVTDGYFSATLSGLGSDGTVGDLNLPAGTNMDSDYTGVTLDAALLLGAAAGALEIVVYADEVIDGNNPQFTIPLSAVPTSFIADTALNVAAGSVTLTGIAAASKSNVGGGAHAGKICLLDAGGLVDTSMLPVVPVANGGTGAITAPLALAALGAAEEGVNTNITELTGLTTALSIAQGGTGSTTQNFVDLTTNQSIAGDKTFSGASTFTGNVSQTGATTFGTGTGAVSLNGAVTAGAAGTGLAVTNNATVGGTLGVAGTTTLTGNLAQTGATTISTGTGAITLNGAATAAAAGTGLAVTNNATVGGTLAVTGATTFTGATTHSGSIILSNQQVATGAPTPYDGSSVAKVFDTTKSVVFLTGTTATSISCMTSGTASGQMFYIVATGAIAAAPLTIVNGTACGANGGAGIITNTNANLVSATAASRASFGFIWDSVSAKWHVIAVNL